MLTTETKQKIDDLVDKFPKDRHQSAVIGALTAAQQQNGGWLTQDLMNEIADYLSIPKISVYEVASFYSMFELKPVGKYKISVCTNVSCMLCGSDQIVQHLKDKLKIGFNETTEDNKFTLKEVECLAACGGAPMMQIADKYYENLTPEGVDQILASLE